MITSTLNDISIKDIKNRLSIIDVAIYYGAKIKKSGSHFLTNINPLRDEKTSSLALYPETNSFCDFGTMIGGDSIKFIQEAEKCNFSEALKKAFSLISGNCIYHFKKLKPKTYQISEDYEVNIVNLKNQFDSFERLTFSNLLHREELLSIAPMWLYKEANEDDLELFKSMCKFDPVSKTLVCACFDNSSGLEYTFKGFKRRRFINGKWVNAKGTKTNDIAYVRVFTDNNPIYVIEGYHDLLVAILLGIDFIAIPNANFKNLSYFDEHNFKDRTFVFICEDKTGYSGMHNIAKYLASKAMLIDLIQLNNTHNSKLDLSDFIINFNDISGAIYALSNK